MIDKSSEAINSFYSYLRAVLDNPDVIETKTLEEEASNYLNRNPHVKENIDFHSLVGGIKERIGNRARARARVRSPAHRSNPQYHGPPLPVHVALVDMPLCR